MPQDKRPTMYDVARAAGVSQKSVSRVVNNETHVTARLRAKVEAAILALGYEPDLAARSLAASRSFTLGLLIGEMGPSYNAQIANGTYRGCVAHDYNLRIDTLSFTEAEDVVIDRLDAGCAAGRCDGFVLAPPFSSNSRVLDYLEDKGLPYSRISPDADFERSPAVWMDDRAAAAAVADLLTRNGHRHIGLVNGPDSHVSARQRREGFLARLREIDPDAVVLEAQGGYRFDPGIEAGRALLDRSDHPTAIFAANDDSAAGVLVACQQLGLSVPRDVSLCGFDDSWVARSVWPHLTTIHQPVEEMAEAAVHLLLGTWPPAAPYRVLELDFHLVERESVGPVR